jgi:predicted secreted protein
MFTTFIKLLLTTFFFSILLYADGDDIQITVSNTPTIDENDGTATFTIKLSEEPDWCEEVTVDYYTIDGSAEAENDYNTTRGSVTFYGFCPNPFNTHAGSNSDTINVNIINDNIYEVSEYFYLKVTNSTVGYQVTDDSGYARIRDDDIQPIKLITFNNKDITEADSDTTLDMVALFNQNIPSSLTLTYHTEDNSAIEGADYISVNRTITVPANSDRALLPITIKGNLKPETDKNFKVIIDSISEGTITVDSTATATIIDDDKIEVDVECSDINESNSGESNNIECEIFLVNRKPYPSGEADFNINYTSADGSSESAQAGDDYTAINGHVTFTTGDIKHIVNIQTIGDNNVEPDENVKLIISGSSYIIDTKAEAEIINDDDGEYPQMGFGSDMSTTDFYVIEGNSSQRNLNFIFRLDSPAVAGSSFEYYTEDKDSNESSDYVPISTTYNLNVGDRNITIPIKVNGDTDIENDETFYLKIRNEHHLHIRGHTAKGHILNDDGSYPELTFDMATYSEIEGNSGQREINVTLSLNQDALADSSFDYKTEDDTALSSDNDYNEINTTKYTFIGGERSITIPVTINGDESIEGNEEFYFKIFNKNHIKLASDIIKSKGQITNDDHAPLAIRNVGEFRFDDCGHDEWKIDHSSIKNDAIGTVNSSDIITNDDKSYMCTSINGYGTTDVEIPHNANYKLTEGTISMLLYDHHNVSNRNSWLFQKGILEMKAVRVGGDAHKGTIDVYLDGNNIHTNEVFFTNSGGGDSDSQWVHITFTFGQNGMKLYINGVLKGSNSYTGGINAESSDIILSKLSGYYDEFYIFEGQMSDIQVQNLYQNTLNNKNLDGTDRDCGCYVQSDPFTCNSSMYISSSTNRETSATGKMWLHRVDTTENPFDFEVMEDTGASKLYNATAYNPNDNYIYGLYHRELIRLSRSAELTNLGTITQLPSRFDRKQLYAGAISNGYYYVSGRNSKNKQLFKIKLSDFSVTDINLSKKVAIQDFSFYKNVDDSIPEGVFLYGVDKNSKLTKIDVRDGTVTQVGSNHSGYKFDSSFSDKNGRFFANDSLGHGFFEFDLNTGVKSFISNSQSATFNDGANCINSSLIFTDYGDAPSSYGSPRHNIANGIFMGNEVDHDILSYSDVTATGDDTHGIDDEDGITLTDGSDINGSFFEVETTQNFKIKVSKNGYLNAWIDYNIDGDFEDFGEKIFSAKSLTTGEHILNFNIPTGVTTNTTTYIRFRYSSTPNITATQNVGDGEVEDYAIKFGTDAFRGVFNIERTNSGTFPINTESRHAWYTQVVGRDFDYSIVFYEEDMSAEKIISNLTLKVELVDTKKNSTLYERYFHIPSSSTQSRFNISHLNSNAESDDLSEQSHASLPSIPASKDVRFRISYEEDSDGNIIQTDCVGFTESDFKTCYNNLPSIHNQPAKDNFAIRPKAYYLSLSDRDKELKNSTNSSQLRLASGYDYNLTVIATDFNTINPAKGYNYKVIRELEFNDSSNCHNQTSPSEEITFTNGLFNDQNFTHDNVGKYKLKLIDDNNWTYVDIVKNDCNNNNLTPTGNGEQKIGCNIIAPNFDMNLKFYPYQFNLDDINFSVLPIDDNEFIYMDTKLKSVGVQLIGDIIAQNADAKQTTNFTQSCSAEEVTLQLEVNITSDTGINTPLLTTADNNGFRQDVLFNRSFNFNNSFTTNENNISSITTPITIRPIDFTETNSSNDGKVSIDLRYNISKDINRTINPIKIGFKQLIAKSLEAHSHAKQSDKWIPQGSKDLNETRLFYFTQVTPDKVIYPQSYFTGVPIIVKTPLSVDIFCKNLTNKNFCTQMNIFKNTLIHASPRKEKGWYISTNHNNNFDGNITNLESINSSSLTVTPHNNIPFSNGQNYLINSTVNNANHTINRVNIILPSQLQYLAPYYSIPVIGHKSSEWSGIGKAGNIIDTKANTKKSGKNDW